MLMSGSFKYFIPSGWCCCNAQSLVQKELAFLSCNYSTVSCNQCCMSMKYFSDRPPDERVCVIKSAWVVLSACLYHPICSGRVRRGLQLIACFQMSAGPQISRSWSRDRAHMNNRFNCVNFHILQINFSADLTFASFSSPSRENNRSDIP